MAVCVCTGVHSLEELYVEELQLTGRSGSSEDDGASLGRPMQLFHNFALQRPCLAFSECESGEMRTNRDDFGFSFVVEHGVE